jgi:spore coat polysaccharide biosynthesis protein SpsF (cytidylyltransferase family)
MAQNEINNSEIEFKVMITSADLLIQQIQRYNEFHGTDIRVIRVINDEVPFCDIKIVKGSVSDAFNLGFSLALYEQKLREEGKIDW